MDKLQLLALASKLRAETLDETPGSGGVTMADVATERGYRAGWNDRTRSIATEVELYASHAAPTLTERERVDLTARFPPSRRDLLAMDAHNAARARVDAKVDSVSPAMATRRAEVRASLEADTIAEMLVRAKHGRMPRYFDSVQTDNNVVTFTRNGHTYTATLVEVRS